MHRVLVVEDEPELLQALMVRLTACGYACSAARNGIEGLAKAQEERPDLIVADLLMPEMSGAEMIRRLAAEQATASIPVIVLTAVPLKQAGHVQAARVLPKPFDSQALVDAMREILNPNAAGGPSNG